jgi:hypothetical protein
MLPTQICSIRKFPNAPPFRFKRPRDGFARARNKPLLPSAAARNGGAYGAAVFAARVLNHMAEPGPIAAVYCLALQHKLISTHRRPGRPWRWRCYGSSTNPSGRSCPVRPPMPTLPGVRVDGALLCATNVARAYQGPMRPSHDVFCLATRLAPVMLVLAAVSATRLAAVWLPIHQLSAVDPTGSRSAPRDSCGADTGIAHLLMGIAMAGMLAPDVNALPPQAWEAIFGVLAAWFAWRRS